MQSNAARALVALAAVAIIIVGFVALGGDGDSGDQPAAPTAEPSVQTIRVVNGRPVGGMADLTFNKGDEIRFAVESDTADEVHVHGYDVMEDVPVGGKVTFDFAADVEGIFEVELEGSATQIAELTVNP